MVQINPKGLHDLVVELFTRRDTPSDIAADLATHLIEADRAGYSSHGLSIIPTYLKHIRDKGVNPQGRPELKHQTGNLLQYDGQNGFGQHVARVTVEAAIEQAKASGFTIVTVANSHHMGRLGYYGELVARAGLSWLGCVNVVGREPMVAPWGGAQGRLATNPLSFAWPLAGDRPALVADFATSGIALNRARVRALQGEKMDPGLLIDNQGKPSTDPKDLFTDPPGALLPFGGHKGFALGLMIELLAGVLSSGGTLQPEHKRTGTINNNLFGLVMNPAFMADPTWIAHESAAFIDYITSCPPQAGVTRVLYPGEPEAESRVRQKEHLILTPQVWDLVRDVLAADGLNPDQVVVSV